ncbi:MAG: tRNA lysidine(34) synthetase TilS [Bacteroidales bacterium]|nr:tRNA lysidine(34) synthetase TilS [Bacteroidales bacterium]MBR6092678.1 tRNA lysidine(34) synthetase TilS [Bacteroidales bacterium]
MPLKTRHWQQGDRFRPLGMRGTKLVSDFFNDNGFTTFQKKNTLILTDNEGEIVWIVGYRIDDRFKITEKTKTIYEIKFGD